MYQMYFVDVLNWLQFVSLTNRFQVAVHLFSNRSQMTSKCGKNKKVAHEAQLSVTDVTHWKSFNDDVKKSVNDDIIYTSVLQ